MRGDDCIAVSVYRNAHPIDLAIPILSLAANVAAGRLNFFAAPKDGVAGLGSKAKIFCDAFRAHRGCVKLVKVLQEFIFACHMP